MRFEITPVVKNLLILNILILVADLVLPIDLGNLFALRYIGSSQFAPYQIITYMFAHADSHHLIGNMITLLFMGPLLERFVGSKDFLVLYFICGIGAALVHAGVSYMEITPIKEAIQDYLREPAFEKFFVLISDHFSTLQTALTSFIDEFETHPNDPKLLSESVEIAKVLSYRYVEESSMLGASGAVMGVAIGAALLFPNSEIFLLMIPFPIKVKYFALLYIASDVYGIIKNNPNDNVAHFAHLGGMIFAFFIVQYWKTRRDRFY
jgi:membrane associated rhomboid family serine protease